MENKSNAEASTITPPKSRKMKRFVSFDFLRGCAMIGVLGFHILNQAYDAGGRIGVALDQGNIAFILLVAILGFLGTFFPLFIALSGLVNIITVKKQCDKRIAGLTDQNEIKKQYSAVIRSQIYRGLFVAFLGYFSESLLNGLLLEVIVGGDELLADTIKPLFFTQVLVMIGLGVAIISTVYIKLLQKGRRKKEICKIFVIIGIIVIVLTPFMNSLLSLIPGFWDRPANGWDTRTWYESILFFILTPLVIDFNPLFPNFAAICFGAIIGIMIADGKPTKKFFNKVVFTTMILFIAGAFILVILDYVYIIDGGLGSIGDLEALVPLWIYAFIDSLKVLAENLMSLAGSLLFMIWILYVVDIRGKGDKFATKTKFFRRFGTMTLTLWCIQFLALIPLILFHTIVELFVKSGTDFGDSVIMNEGLNGWELIGIIFYVIMIYHLILWLWQKVNFTGSFEWLTAKILSRSRKDSTDRLTKSINETESIVKEPNPFWGVGTRIGLLLIWLFYAVAFTVITMLPDIL